MELSIRGYARHRGISDGAVRKAISVGRISKNKNGKIDSEIADREWLTNTNPARVKDVKEKQEDEIISDNDNVQIRQPMGANYQQGRAVKEIYQAKLTRLQYEKESKKVMPVDEVRVIAFNTGRVIRDRMLNIPDRVIPQLIGRTDAFAMKEILTKEINKALEELAKNEF